MTGINGFNPYSFRSVKPQNNNPITPRTNGLASESDDIETLKKSLESTQPNPLNEPRGFEWGH